MPQCITSQSAKPAGQHADDRERGQGGNAWATCPGSRWEGWHGQVLGCKQDAQAGKKKKKKDERTRDKAEGSE